MRAVVAIVAMLQVVAASTNVSGRGAVVVVTLMFY